MDLCVIPPIPHLRQFPQKRHLILSHLLVNDDYRRYYQERKKAGDFIILDNSAHENGIGEGGGKLLLQALDMEPDEIVVPDALDNAAKTLDFARRTTHYWLVRDPAQRIRNLGCRLMYVPQGKNQEEWAYCFDRLVIWHEYLVTHHDASSEITIGISKDYGDLRPLVELVVYRKNMLKIQIHLLGSTHRFWEAAILRYLFPEIRSMDTAKPFVWAQHGLIMDERHALPATLPPRPENFFFQRMPDEQLSLARRNCDYMRTLVEL